MERFDSEKAARVWQRVRSEGGDDSALGGIAGLSAAEAELAVLFKRIGKQYSAAEALARDCLSNEAILRGICGFAGLPRPQPKFSGNVPKNVLQVCYSRTLQAAGEYEKRSSHPEYGCAFRAMAEKKREHACRILEMAGSMQVR